MKLWERLKTSSKWQAVVLGIIWTLAGPKLQEWGLTQDQVWGVLGALGIGVGAQAAADLGKEAKTEEAG